MYWRNVEPTLWMLFGPIMLSLLTSICALAVMYLVSAIQKRGRTLFRHERFSHIALSDLTATIAPRETVVGCLHVQKERSLQISTRRYSTTLCDGP